MKGLEEQSFLIDVTTIQDVAQFKKKTFSSFYSLETFIYRGRLLVEQKYSRLLLKPPGILVVVLYKQLCFSSFTFDENITINDLFIQPHLESPSSSFGQVLDIGFIKDRDYFVGQCYAVLNLDFLNAKNKCFEKYSRVIEQIDSK